MKVLIICESVHHGNTKKVADAMEDVLKAEVKKPADVDAGRLGEYDLIGFGSGIWVRKMHKNLIKLADTLPEQKKKAFIFSTSGGYDKNFIYTQFHGSLKDKLVAKGYEIVGEFTCRGYSTVGPLVLIGGMNKGRPNESDLEDAKRFAARLAGSRWAPAD